jgi:rare lipoprotein A (peptidoglycan hydrolase)
MNDDDDRGVWIGAILLLVTLATGIVCGARVMEGTASREAKLLQARLTEAEIQRDAAVAELEGSRVMLHLWTGIASWYGEAFHGRPTASGHVYDMNAMTAASRTIPLGTMIIVENVETGRMVPCLINDRGPYITGRGLDVSKGVAERLGILKQGIARVRVYEMVQGRPSRED